jgi:hypothetical protein
MKVRCDNRPELVSFEKDKGNAIIRFAQNIIENIDENGNKYFDYDEYIAVTTDREGLEQEVGGHYAGWLDMAKIREEETLKDAYHKKAQEYIRQIYSEHDEAKLINEAVVANINSEPVPSEYIAYRAYVQECKERAKALIYS